MSTPKRHHYVPQTYLRKFCTPPGTSETIHFLDNTKSQTGDIHSISINKICIERHLYRLNIDTADPQLIEKFYAENIDAKYNEIFDVLTNDGIEELTKEQRESIIEYLVTQLYRSPKWKNFHTEVINRVLEKMYFMCQQMGSETFSFEGEQISINGKSLEQLQNEWHTNAKNGILLTQLDVANKLIAHRISSDSIMVSKLEDDREFITSDNPVIYYNPDVEHQMPFHPANILQMPLSPKHMVLLLPGSDTKFQHLITRKNCNGQMSQLERLIANYDQLKSSERFVIGTKSSLEKYLETKEESERPLTDEEIDNIKPEDPPFTHFKKRGLL